ncbi:site-specific integrase [Moheibacter sediminis]|uniref:Site-specific recombinase XerD n=1 Tax=Moheibacter sediminis TaxID=1434700 RepID=A0A1W1YBP0_9FLAO|nr:site-specific integrase [Moheibacter sediminis]SMC33573.1 Site-specific recombinase XerD [Moheibacter sediminis]
MNFNKIIILFLLQKNRVNKQGNCPIRCRITHNQDRKEFSIGLFINPKHWHSKLQKAKPPNDENDFINNELSLIKNKINQAFLFLQVQENEFTVDDVYAQYIGKPITRRVGIISHYSDFLEKYKKLIGIEIKQVTWNKFNYILNDLNDFLQWKYKQKDFYLKDLDMEFIIEFEYYLKVNKQQKQITINKALQRFKKVVKTSVEAKIISTFPFNEHKPKSVKNQIVYLTVEELAKLEQHQFFQIRLQQVADMFIFCCYTGLAYNEMAHIQLKHIVKGFDGNDWIKMVREKTQREISIPILPKSAKIIEKYQDVDSPYIFAKISNQKFNSYLKEIATIVGINKNLTHHIARKTFATTVLLYNDVPMEIVSELLGHSKITITQEHYGKVVQKKVSEHILKLADKLDKK